MKTPRYLVPDGTYMADPADYYSYSTGDTHFLCYAVGDSPYGPFTYKGVVLTPVVGWTAHHCITEFKGKSYLFHHDSRRRGARRGFAASRWCNWSTCPTARSRRSRQSRAADA